MRLIFGLLMFLFSSNSIAEIDWNKSNVKWHGYVDGLLEMRRENKNALLIVYAEWCGVCKDYSRMFHDPKIVTLAKNVVLIRLDQDKDSQYTKKFELDGGYVPRTFILSSDGTVRQSPYKSKKYDFYLPPGNNKYLADLLQYISATR